jgi:hypothetical protein
MTTTVVVFLIVYIGMILGGLPFLQLDRTGVALLGAIALITFDAIDINEAAEAVHLPTIILFFSGTFETMFESANVATASGAGSCRSTGTCTRASACR